jgi:predicted secreted protein
MSIKKSDATTGSEKSAGTRRDVMKLSMAVAAFGAAMGIAGPGAAQSSRKIKMTDLKASKTRSGGFAKLKNSSSSKTNPGFHFKKNAN